MEQKREETIDFSLKWNNFKKKLWQGWKEELFWAIIMLLLIYTAWAYQKDMEICFEIIKNPCEYCYAYEQEQRVMAGGSNITRLVLPEGFLNGSIIGNGLYYNDT